MSLVAVVLALAGCGGGGDPAFDGAPDAGAVDAAAGDAGMDGATSACATYCGCLFTNCPSPPFPDQAACEADCAGLTSCQLDYRTKHCDFAAGDPVTHCPHATGTGETCP